MELDTIYNMDYIEGIKQINDKSIDLVIADPPYWHHKSPGKPYSERKQCNTKSKFSTSKLFNAEGYLMGSMSDFGENEIETYLSAIKPKMRIMNAYTFCSESQVPYYCVWAEKNNYMFSILVWEKPLSIINKNRYSQNIEYIVRIYDYGTALNRIENNILYNRVDHTLPCLGRNKLHPTQKPLGIVTKYILLSSVKGDVVLDPFMGSGTTAIACIQSKRHFIGFEINKEYYDKSMQRINAEQSQLELF